MGRFRRLAPLQPLGRGRRAGTPGWLWKLPAAVLLATVLLAHPATSRPRVIAFLARLG